MTAYYKFTRPGRRPTHADNGFVWPAPSGKRPGKWTEPVLDLAACERGYHLTTADHLLDWLSDELWVAEGRGRMIDAGDKVVFESARLVRRVPEWNDRTARLFSADCAEDALAFARTQDVPVLTETIRVVRAFADGQATREEMDAARAAAGAAMDAAWDAAWAAGEADWDAARAAARAAGAARDAAWDAAWAAGAARDAAWAAGAARDAAGAAARAAQTRRLHTYLGIES